MTNTCVFCDTEIGSASGYERGTFEYGAREMHMCDDCYEKLMNIPKPANKIKWGQRMGRCPYCRTPFYEINVTGDMYVCVACENEIHLNDEEQNLCEVG
jgi:hypothetical protein